MRILTFDPTDPKYDILYTALISQTPTGSTNPTRSEQKVHGKLLDKLEAIGQVRTPTDNEGKPRAFLRDEVKLYETVGGGRVILEEEEYRMCKQRAENIIPYLHPAKSREHERMMCWLEALPEVPAGEVTAVHEPAQEA